MTEEQGMKERRIYLSPCCNAVCLMAPTVTVLRDYCGRLYYRDMCTGCGALCWPKLSRLFDSSGVECMPGDVIECPDCPVDHAERYHAVYIEHEQLMVRDTGNNNSHMYTGWGQYYTLGPYWKNLDKVTDDDLEYYWNTTREDAEAKAKEEGTAA